MMQERGRIGGQGSQPSPGARAHGPEEAFITKTKGQLGEILSKGDPKLLVECAEQVGKYLADGKMSTGQVRTVLTEIQALGQFDERRLQLLRPKFAYAAGRHGGRVKDFQQIVDYAITLTNKDNFSFFKAFIEAVVAYHRFYGGKD